MSTPITSAMPKVVFKGINDVSIRSTPLVPLNRPTFLPKFWFFGQQGPSGPQVVDGAAANSLFGADSFDYLKSYANHATPFINEVFRQGGTCVLERIIPSDALPEAGFRLSADVLSTKVPVYQRNSDGSIATDPNTGNPIPVTPAQTLQGYVVKWVIESLLDNTNASTYGLGEVKQGDQTDATTSTQSQRYPIADFKTSWQGASGQNLAARIYAPTVKSSTPVDSGLMSDTQCYPFRLAFLQRTSPLVSPTLVSSQLGASYVTFGLKPNAVDINTGQRLYGPDVIIPAYQSINNTDGTPNQYGPFGGVYFYQDNIDTLLNEFFVAEAPVADGFSDFASTDTPAAKKYLFNPFSGMSSAGVKYHSFVLNTTDSNAVSLNELTTLYAKDGSDGTMTIATYDAAVQAKLLQYGDPNSILQNTAKNPESDIWDPGFSMATKKAMGNVIALRKDTYITGNTHVAGGAPLTVDQELSAGLAIYAAWAPYIESEEFGTPTTRASIFAQSYTLISSNYTARLPVSFEILSKSAAYMGAGNRIWNGQLAFDNAENDPGSLVTLGNNLNVEFIPASGRQQFWNGKINWVEPFDRTRFFFPAVRTVVVNDTSVNTSFINAHVCCELEKIGENAWRRFTGSSKYTAGQLVQRVENYVNSDVASINSFDGRAVVQPTATVTGADAQRGYSWSLKIGAFMNNMMTVETLEIDTDRLSSLQTTQTAAIR